MSFTCILVVHRFVFEGCARRSRGLCTRARQHRCLFLSRHPLSCARLSPFLSLLPALSFPPSVFFALSPFLAFPSDIFALAVPPRPAALPGCRLPSSVLPASLRPVMSCLLSLASSPTPRHNLPQTLKKIQLFCKEIAFDDSGNGNFASAEITLS